MLISFSRLALLEGSGWGGQLQRGGYCLNVTLFLVSTQMGAILVAFNIAKKLNNALRAAFYKAAHNCRWGMFRLLRQIIKVQPRPPAPLAAHVVLGPGTLLGSPHATSCVESASDDSEMWKVVLGKYKCAW